MLCVSLVQNHKLCHINLSMSKLSARNAGWLDNEPSRVTGRLEVRPAAELGPIIVCLDTSGQLRPSALHLLSTDAACLTA